jgi:hypothetical protein
MSVSPINSNPPVAPPLSPAALQVPQGSGGDRDGDNDGSGRVHAATPPGVGVLVDKSV